MPDNIEVKDFLGEPRTITFAKGRTVPALWLDDFSDEDLDRIVADESSSKTYKEQIAVARKHIKMLAPSVTDEDLRPLAIRDTFALAARLKMFEGQGVETSKGVSLDRPLETESPAQSSSAPS